MAICPGCGGDVPPSKGRKPRKWCSDSCRRSHSRLVGDSEVLTVDEVLVLLSQAAKSGTVAAMQSLLKYHTDAKAKNADEDTTDRFQALDAGDDLKTRRDKRSQAA